MARLKFSYSGTIRTNRPFKKEWVDHYLKRIIQHLKFHLHARARLNETGEIKFSVKKWSRNMFDPGAMVFSAAIDGGKINLIDQDGRIGISFTLEYVGGLVLLYLMAYMVILIGILSNTIKLISWTTLGILVVPPIVMFPLLVVALRILVGLLENVIAYG